MTSATEVAQADPAGPAPGSFTAEAWARTAGVRRAIDALPFLRELADGSLPREVFAYYMAQDAHYLADYGRALAACAQQSTASEDLVFWSTSAARSVEVERQLHATFVADLTATEPSPTCVAYTSYLLARAGAGSYPVLAAAVLPCFWIYDDVGRRLRAAAGDLGGHPYGSWIATYGDPAFAASTAQARGIVDRLAAAADASTVERMHHAFADAARYEWMFWDAAHRREAWPV